MITGVDIVILGDNYKSYLACIPPNSQQWQSIANTKLNNNLHFILF